MKLTKTADKRWMRKVALYGLEAELEQQLRSALGHETIQISPESCSDMERMSQVAPDVIFSSFSCDLTNLLRAVSAPVVVVSRHAESSEYIDAMEAGASDYCAAPFEPGQLRWILKSPQAE